MASGFHFIGLLCLTSGLWIGANARRYFRRDNNEQHGNQKATCPAGWVPSVNRCYLFRVTDVDWATAERTCTSLGGNLASIQTPNEYTFIRDLIFKSTNSHKTTWVGGSDAEKEGVWLWSDGSNFLFNGWAKSEPNNVNGGENCMEINFGGLDYINDAKCDLKRPFICARKP